MGALDQPLLINQLLVIIKAPESNLSNLNTQLFPSCCLSNAQHQRWVSPFSFLSSSIAHRMVKKASLLPTALSLLPLLVAALPTSDFVVSSASSSAAPRDAAVVRAETLAALWRSPRAAASLARIASAAAPLTSPQQIRLSPAHAPGGMRVTWATGAALPPGTAASVSWWPEGSASNVSTASAVEYTYSAGEGGWGGALFTAIMTPLAPGVTYAYRVASGAEVSDARSFSLPPEAGAAASARIAVCADMGTIVPLGWAVADRLIEDHLDSAEGRYDAVLLAGDLSYSTVSPGSCSASNPGCDSLEFVWDFFGVQIEPFSSTGVWGGRRVASGARPSRTRTTHPPLSFSGAPHGCG